MTDLDKQVAEAQGWTLEVMPSPMQGFEKHWLKPYGSKGPLAHKYTPSTDHNQAVAFWNSTGLMLFIKNTDDEFVVEIPYVCRATDQEVVAVAKHSTNLADALCRATLIAKEGKQ